MSIGGLEKSEPNGYRVIVERFHYRIVNALLGHATNQNEGNLEMLVKNLHDLCLLKENMNNALWSHQLVTTTYFLIYKLTNDSEWLSAFKEESKRFPIQHYHYFDNDRFRTLQEEIISLTP